MRLILLLVHNAERVLPTLVICIHVHFLEAMIIATLG